MRSSDKVLLLVENNAYPFDVRVRREAQVLRDAGYKVTVISPRGKQQPWAEVVDGVMCYRFPAPPGGVGLLSYAFEFAYATLAMFVLSLWVGLRRGIDVIHAANPPDTLFVIGAFWKLFGKKYVFDHHDLAPETYLSRFKQPRENAVSRTLRLLERCSFAVADIVIATNESYKQVAMQRGGKRADQVFVVRNGPPRAFQALKPDPALAARAPHLAGYIGTMGPQDGVDYWLRAIHQMVHTLGRTDFLAVIIGSGDAAPSLHALAKTLQIEPYVWFTGRIPDFEAKSYLSTVEVCIHPDPSSPLNDRSTMNKMMEYMALGKPTVAFDLTETRFSGQGAALYTTPNDELEFARNVLRLFDDADERSRLSQLGLQRFASALAWEYSEPVLLRAYSEGLGLLPAAAQAPQAVGAAKQD
ncbi:MAG TPA: glycosyltransferase family 4 protein [Ideonella sp.]|nr:glycosyltransferase family 4 protein [Ideonella sp.]